MLWISLTASLAAATPVAVTPTLDPAALAAALDGPGLTVTSVVVTPARSFKSQHGVGPGVATLAPGPAGLDGEIALSNGFAADIDGPAQLLDGHAIDHQHYTNGHTSDVSYGTPADVTLVEVEFTLDPGYDGLVLQHTVGTEEYEGGDQGRDYADGFGAFVATDTGAGFGPAANLALLPDNNQLLPIDTEYPFWELAAQSSETSFDWLLPRFTLRYPLPAGVRYGLSFLVFDEDDNRTDTAGFVGRLEGCAAGCTWDLAMCGDGRVDAGEVCDDGNTALYDGCTSGCATEVDSDGDGLYDDYETDALGSDPLLVDTDGDGSCDSDDPCPGLDDATFGT